MLFAGKKTEPQRKGSDILQVTWNRSESGIPLLLVSQVCEDIGTSPLKTVNCSVKDKLLGFFFKGMV